MIHQGPIHQRPRQLTPDGVRSAGWGYIELGRWGYCIPPRLMQYGRECFTQEFWCGRGTQNRDPVSCSFSFLLGTTQPTTVVHSELPSLCQGAQMRFCKWDFEHLPFQRVPRFLSDSHLSLVDRIPADFHSQMLHGLLFPAVVLWAGERSLELRSHTP